MTSLDQYRGLLEPEEVAEGINAARESAERLASDARLLFEKDKFPSATALAALSIEEAGKIPILRSLALARDESEAEDEWQRYRWHTEKNVAWRLPDLVADGATSLDDFRPLFDDKSDHPQLLNHVKQIALYSDCLGDRHWSIPSEVIEEGLARGIVKIAELLIPSREVQAEEIKLWVKHLSPVWHTTDGAMKSALIAWETECVDRGIIPDDDAGMREFVFPDWSTDSSSSGGNPT